MHQGNPSSNQVLANPAATRSGRIAPAWLAILALIAIGCADVASPDPANVDASAGGDTGADAQVDSGPEVPFEAPPCAPKSGDPKLLRLRGTIFTGDLLLSDGEIYTSAETGQILCVGPDCSAAPGADTATVVCTDGIITPGLIDPHNHGNYNHLPRWKHTKRYKNRYEWQADGDYKDFKKSQQTTFSKAGCETMKWAELRALVSGTTSMQGTSGPKCINGWVRDLDGSAEATGLQGYKIEDQVTKISGVSDSNAKKWATGLQQGTTQGVVLHLAEGIDASSKQEWYDLIDKGLFVQGVSLIHAAGLTGVELAEARQKNIRIIWSPQSNLDLYGDTTRVPAALNLGLGVALGPDWTPSGSMNQLEEMKCARQLSAKRWGGMLTDERLVRMTTVEAAAAVGAGDMLGRLATGYIADIAVFSGNRGNPWRSIVDARPEQVRLVLIGGKPLYGDDALMSDLTGGACEAFDACGVAKRVCMQDDTLDKGQQTVDDIRNHLLSTLAAAKAKDNPSASFAYGYELFPLFECGEAADELIHCDVAGTNVDEPSAEDLDGDGHANADDGCPQVFDPDQGDLDADGKGDACDVCPLVPGDDAAACPKPGPDDLDGDGVANAEDNCPEIGNGSQADQDQDGKGDACDVCPKGPNPGDAPCPALSTTATALNQDKSLAAGELVQLEGLVVTAVVPQKGSALPQIWAQVVPGVPWGGVLLQLAKNAKPPVQSGDQIRVVGKIADLYGLRALVEVQIVTLGAGRPVQPLVVPVETLAKAPGSLPYRSLLVEVQDVEVVADNADAETGKDFGEILLKGGLRVDDTIVTWGTDATRPKTGDAFQAIRGVMTFTYAQEKLLPRGQGDLVAK